jgi:hypothetical protein
MPVTNEVLAAGLVLAGAYMLWQQKKLFSALEAQLTSARQDLKAANNMVNALGGADVSCLGGGASPRPSGSLPRTGSLPKWVTENPDFKKLLPHPLPPPAAQENRATMTNPFGNIQDESEFSSAFLDRLHELYPGAMNHEEAAVAIKHVLRQRGFTAKGSIALVAQCRDEITKKFIEAIDTTWLGSFNIGALAGTVICGTTGFNAALHHAPQDSEGKERYVIFCGPHIAIDENGVVGNVHRRGRSGVSSACGALIAFTDELANGHIDVNDNALDTECVVSLPREGAPSSPLHLPGSINTPRHTAPV